MASIQAIRLGADRTNPGVTANSQPLLIISGILAGLWALGVIGIQVLAWFGMAIGSGAGRYYCPSLGPPRPARHSGSTQRDPAG